MFFPYKDYLNFRALTPMANIPKIEIYKMTRTTLRIKKKSNASIYKQQENFINFEFHDSYILITILLKLNHVSINIYLNNSYKYISVFIYDFNLFIITGR